MSRTVKRPYTGSKRFSVHCRCHGGCMYCESSRLRYRPIGEDLLKDGLQEAEDLIISLNQPVTNTGQKPQYGSPRKVIIDLTDALLKVRQRLKESP